MIKHMLIALLFLLLSAFSSPEAEPVSVYTKSSIMKWRFFRNLYSNYRNILLKFIQLSFSPTCSPLFSQTLFSSNIILPKSKNKSPRVLSTQFWRLVSILSINHIFQLSIQIHFQLSLFQQFNLFRSYPWILIPKHQYFKPKTFPFSPFN